MSKTEIFIDGLTENNFVISKGCARAIPPQDKDAKFYQWTTAGSRDFDTALEERIRIPYRNGMLVTKNPDGSIKFDDRKLRYAGHTIENGIYNIKIGVTHFGEVKLSSDKASRDAEFDSFLRKRGLEDFGDEFAYFAAPLAVCGVPVTPDKEVLVFRRKKDSNILLPGYWHVIAGLLEGNTDIFEKEDPTGTLRDSIYKGLRKEFKEEADAEDFRIQLTGLANSVGVDFTHNAYLGCSAREFLETMKYAPDATDHDDVRILKSNEEVRKFLTTEKEIVPACAGALHLYLNTAA